MIERDVAEVSGVRVRSLTAGEQIDLEAASKAADGDIRKLIAVQLHAYVCDEAGNAVLSAEQAAQMVETRKSSTVRAILEKAGTLNQFDQEAIRGN
jgi:hypothetical protein